MPLDCGPLWDQEISAMEICFREDVIVGQSVNFMRAFQTLIRGNAVQALVPLSKSENQVAELSRSLQLRDHVTAHQA